MVLYAFSHSIRRKPMFRLPKATEPKWHLFCILGIFAGWYRECTIIPTTNDADFGVHYEDYQPKLLEELLSSNSPLKLYRILGRVRKHLKWTIAFRGKKMVWHLGHKINIPGSFSYHSRARTFTVPIGCLPPFSNDCYPSQGLWRRF